jgi:peptidoglycan/xylan/chitin deacetylase (PgdA/CDA1 family)
MRADDTQSINIVVHGIGEPARPLAEGEHPTWVSVEQFEAMLDAAVGLPHVVITFDDGNASDLEIGLPRLVERGLTARFFVLAGCLGEPGRLSAEGVRELQGAGMLIGSHGWAHRNWRTLDWSRPDSTEVQEETVQARQVLEDVTGSEVSEVAVPFGSYDRRVLAGLRRAGSTRVWTSDAGRARPDSWLQPRNSMRGGYDLGWASRVMTERPSLVPRTRTVAVRTIKRLRA